MKKILHYTLPVLPRTGTVLSRNLINDLKQEYFLYIPTAGGAGVPVFVTVHGIKRMAIEHALEFASFAEHYGVVLVAPLFPEGRFCDYQRLGRDGRGDRADLALNRILAEVGFLTGANTDKLYMFGYSGGGQFVHRYAFAYPGRTARIVVAAAGWYTFPDSKVKYPRGISKPKGLKDIQFDPVRFLSVPTCVVVGRKDTKRDHNLNKSGRIDQQQGVTRLERGKNWIKAMRAAARSHHLDTRYIFEELPACNHCFVKCVRRGKMGRRVFDFLFGPARNLKMNGINIGRNLARRIDADKIVTYPLSPTRAIKREFEKEPVNCILP
ncbi:MAG: hypothetical protein BA868_01875 [Desulfobacterales bacterium C00003106]|jgi:dienelactone hydrolase|nr:MAG: hypothetical protein BA868_01875 [Desulfobacterales bacterium C00003106]